MMPNKRAVVTLDTGVFGGIAKDDAEVQLVVVKGSRSATGANQALRGQQYGFGSHPDENATFVIVRDCVLLESADGADRPALTKGEVCVYSPKGGSSITLRANGDVEIQAGAGAKVSMNATEIALKADAAVDLSGSTTVKLPQATTVGGLLAARVGSGSTSINPAVPGAPVKSLIDTQ